MSANQQGLFIIAGYDRIGSNQGCSLTKAQNGPNDGFSLVPGLQ